MATLSSGYSEFKASLGYTIPFFKEGGCKAKKTTKGSNERVEILMSTLGLAFSAPNWTKGEAGDPIVPPQGTPKDSPNLPTTCYL